MKKKKIEIIFFPYFTENYSSRVCKSTTVKLRWLELVGTLSASSTHPRVRAIPSLTIFKFVHVNFMSSRTPRFFDQSCKARVTPVTDQ